MVGSVCWGGAGVKVAAGVRVGDGWVGGAGAVVLETLPAMSVAHGIPARLKRIRGETNEKQVNR